MSQTSDIAADFRKYIIGIGVLTIISIVTGVVVPLAHMSKLKTLPECKSNSGTDECRVMTAFRIPVANNTSMKVVYDVSQLSILVCIANLAGYAYFRSTRTKAEFASLLTDTGW